MPRRGDGPPGLPRPCHSGVGRVVRLNDGFISLIHSAAFTEPDSARYHDRCRRAGGRTGSRGTAQREAVRERGARSRDWRQIRGRAGAQGGCRRKGPHPGVGGAALVRNQGREDRLLPPLGLETPLGIRWAQTPVTGCMAAGPKGGRRRSREGLEAPQLWAATSSSGRRGCGTGSSRHAGGPTCCQHSVQL